MSIFDRFKLRRDRLKLGQKHEREVTAHKEQLLAKNAARIESVGAFEPRADSRQAKSAAPAWRVLTGPHITERATELADKGLYVFKVARKSTAKQVAKAVSDVYGAKVKKVRLINVPRKPKRLGRHIGWRAAYKKALVELAPGQHIEVLPK